ncbi:sugar phosphate permease [Murinocardiopsis flavida]|uniref:Sugar phosphate permease n=1 Tax=Murinocardiopsis flavida TaxID=645275 RepID=A0A2P8CGZ8_9ACTN|nr:MFS transporter [Murinocardiopsis flavida]PSK84182.1 sugar phosphate permease [Murinocardiopsis flavida]
MQTPVVNRSQRTSSGVTLAVVLLGVLVVAMSIAGTAIAVPEIGAELDASGAPLQWVVAAYNLTFAAFTLVFGSLGDLFGRRRTFVTGVVLFTAGSLASAVVTDIWLLDAARALAGIGGAAVMACGGAILASTFDGPARMRAFAAMGTMAGVGIAIGPFLSGWLVALLGWRVSFLVYVAAGVAALIGTLFVAESTSGERPRIDWAGMVAFVAGLSLVMFAIMEGPEAGWGAPAVLAALGGGAVLLVVFAIIESRVAQPVLDLSLVRNRRFMAWCLGTLTTSVGFLGVLVFLPTYLQGVNGASAGTAGLVMLMLTAPVLIAPLIGGRLVNKGVSPRLLITLALLLVTAGNAWLTVLHPGIGAAALLGPLLAIGLGMGLSFGITDGQAMDIVEPGRVGMAAGFLNTVRGGAEALVIAIFGSVLLTLTLARLGSGGLAAQVAAGDLSGGDREFLAAQFTDAWQATQWGVAALCLAATIIVWSLLAPGGARRPGPRLGEAREERAGSEA